MKKILMSLALVSILSISAAAQKTADNVVLVAQGTEICENCPFQGVSNLTDDQKARLKAIPSPCTKAREAKKEAKAAQKECKKAKAEQCRAGKTEYLNQVKAVLTPEQYVEFLEIQYVNPSKPLRPHADKAIKGGKGDKKAKCSKLECKDTKNCTQKPECKAGKDCKKKEAKKDKK